MEQNAEHATDEAAKTKYMIFFFYIKQDSIVLFTRNGSYWPMLNFIANPIVASTTFLCISMLIGILVIYFTAPKQQSMFLSFHIISVFSRIKSEWY
jgi:hypothetical protein